MSMFGTYFYSAVLHSATNSSEDLLQLFRSTSIPKRILIFVETGNNLAWILSAAIMTVLCLIDQDFFTQIFAIFNNPFYFRVNFLPMSTAYV